MKKTIILLTLCLVLPHMVQANPFNMANVSADANWVVHANFDQFRSTDFGKLFLAKLGELGISAKLDNFAKVFSFNPLNDVRDVTIYGESKDEHKTAILINGNFDQERLLALLRLNPEYGEETYGGITLRKWHDDKNGGKMMYGCFYTNNLAVMSSGQDTVKRAIDVLAGKAGHADAAIFNQPALSDSTAFIKIAARKLDGLDNADKQQSFIIKQIQSFSAAAGETNQQFYVNVTLQARSAEAARGITKMVDGLITLATLGDEENGKLSEIAKKTQAACEDNIVRIKLNDSPQAIFEMIAQRIGKK
jgi:hypothetical protein